MPKITNERYKAFFDYDSDFKPYGFDEFDIDLKNIQYKNLDKTQQARALAILLFYTGLRSIELMDLRPHHITKEVQDICIRMKGAKRGIEGEIVLPSDENTREMYDYVKKIPPNDRIFYYFISRSKNKPKYKRFNKFTREWEEVIGDYNNPGHNLTYFCYKWFGFSPYFFRHNRFTLMYRAGANLEDIRLAKLGKTENCARVYIKFDKKSAKKRKKYYPKKG
jgi:integrase